MNESSPNHSQAAAPKADGSHIKRFAPLAAVAIAGIFIGAVAVGVSQQIAGAGKVPAPTKEVVEATPAQRDAQLAAFATGQEITIKSKIDVGKGVQLIAYTSKGGTSGGVFYHLADGSFMAGQMFDPAGTLLTEAHFKQAWPDGAPTPESAADVAGALNAIDPAAMTTVGSSGPEVYMIYEPHCGFCKKSHDALKGLNVTVHYLPVAFLTQESEALAAAMLKGGASVIEKIGDPAALPGLITQYQDQAAEVRPLVEKNAQVMRLAGAQGTPVFLWKSKDGKGGVQRGYLDEASLQKMLAQVAADQAGPVAAAELPSAATN